MTGIQMLGTPGHLVSWGPALLSVQGTVAGYVRAATRPRGFVAMSNKNVTDPCRSALERSP